jgi:hypothetical protein
MVQTVEQAARAVPQRDQKLPIQKKEVVRRGRPRKGVGETQSVKLRRLQIKLSERGFARLETLKHLTDAVSIVDVIRDALRIYDGLVKAVTAGKDVILEDRNAPDVRERLSLL